MSNEFKYSQIRCNNKDYYLKTVREIKLNVNFLLLHVVYQIILSFNEFRLVKISLKAFLFLIYYSAIKVRKHKHCINNNKKHTFKLNITFCLGLLKVWLWDVSVSKRPCVNIVLKYLISKYYITRYWIRVVDSFINMSLVAFLHWIVLFIYFSVQFWKKGIYKYLTYLAIDSNIKLCRPTRSFWKLQTRVPSYYYFNFRFYCNFIVACISLCPYNLFKGVKTCLVHKRKCFIYFLLEVISFAKESYIISFHSPIFYTTGKMLNCNARNSLSGLYDFVKHSSPLVNFVDLVTLELTAQRPLLHIQQSWLDQH